MNKRIYKQSLFKIFRLLIVLALMFQISGTAFAYVTTDQQDYAPGSTVTIRGDNSNAAGYVPDNSVDVAVSGPNGYEASCQATVDSDGTWSCTVILWDSGLAVGNYSYTASSHNANGDPISENGTFTDAASVNFITAPFSVAAGTCSPVITVKTPGTGASGAQVNLTTSSSGGAFYSDSGCTTAITSVTTTGSNDQKSFYYKDTNAGTPTITGSITSPNHASEAQTETITVACTAPSISAQPTSATKTVGDSVLFSVAASGTAPLSYQWRKDSGNVGTNSSSYSIASVATADAGSYDVVVTNSCGSAISNAAALIVNKATATVTLGTLNFTYDGSPKSTTASTIPTGLTVDITYDASTTLPTNAGDYAVVATINDANYQGSASGTLHIAKSDADCMVTGYIGVYDGNAHGASGTCTGAGGESAGTLDLGTTFKDVPGGTAHWVFTGNGNYNDQAGDAGIVITKADATCSISGWTGNYDSNFHGASGSCVGIGGENAGTLNLGASFKDVPGGTAHWVFIGNGNYNDKSGDVAIVIKSWWTLNGFFQPVDMGNVWNTSKNGSTVPLKFKIFAGTTELTDVSAVKSLQYRLVSCSTLPGATEDAIETLAATGSTVLRYDATGGQFIFNWKTPSTASKCYQVTMTTQDASSITAFFKLK